MTYKGSIVDLRNLPPEADHLAVLDAAALSCDVAGDDVEVAMMYLGSRLPFFVAMTGPTCVPLNVRVEGWARLRAECLTMIQEAS